MKTLKFFVGLNCDYRADERAPHAFLYDRYVDAVVKAGAIPVLLPPLTREEDVREQLDPVDALILTGCDDYDPALYAQEPHPTTSRVAPRKQQADLWLAQEALSRGTPLLGICGGMQLLNLVRGGSLIQDIPSVVPGALKHRRLTEETESPLHSVKIEAGSRLAGLLEGENIEIRSSHHQSVDCPGEGFVITARSSDGVIEAIELDDPKRFVVGVQWHPEMRPEARETFQLIRGLLGAANRFRYG